MLLFPGLKSFDENCTFQSEIVIVLFICVCDFDTNISDTEEIVIDLHCYYNVGNASILNYHFLITIFASRCD
jgi:hypothetical protein